MPDEITSNQAPTNTPVPQAPETPISTPPEAVIVPEPVEVPVAPITDPEPVLEPASGHLGGNDPIEPAPAEIIPLAPIIETTAETPVAVIEPALAETPIPVPTKTTQSAPVEPLIETVPEPTSVETLTPVQVSTEATPVAESADSRLGRRVETPEPTQTSEPVVLQVPASVPTPEPVTQAPIPTPTPAQVVATAVTPIVTTTIAQSFFTKSMRELFTKALNARQNKKRKKLDRILPLFAKQTSITNNKVESLLHVSDSTATRYLKTLTKEGKIKQNVKKGHATSYSKI